MQEERIQTDFKGNQLVRETQGDVFRTKADLENVIFLPYC